MKVGLRFMQMSSWRKSPNLRTLLATLILFTSLALTRSAQAIIGAATLNIPAAVVGSALLGGSTVILTSGGLYFQNHLEGDQDPLNAQIGQALTLLYFGIPTGVTALVGLVLLPAAKDAAPGSDPYSVGLVALTEQEAHDAGITPEERAAWNLELTRGELTQVFAQVGDEVLGKKREASPSPSKRPPSIVLNPEIQSLMSEALQGFPPEISRVIEKMRKKNSAIKRQPL